MNRKGKTTCSTQTQGLGALRMTEKVDYALFLLGVVSRYKGQSPSIAQIAKEHGMSFSFLQKVAGLLKNANLIQAERGKTGGYMLLKAPGAISLREIIEAVEGPAAISKCTSHDTTCTRMTVCTVRKGITKVNEEIQTVLLNNTLEALMTH